MFLRFQKIEYIVYMQKVENVVWNAGNFGSMLQVILYAQTQESTPIFDSTHSHKELEWSSFKGKISHPFDKGYTYDNTWIKPYFADESLRYFPHYLNYIKYLQPNKIHMDFGDFVTNYYAWKEPLIESNNLEMDNFFDDLPKFINDLENIMQERLKNHVIDFIQQKQKANLFLLENFRIILNENIQINLSDTLFGIKVCQYINSNEQIYQMLKGDLKNKQKTYSNVVNSKNI